MLTITHLPPAYKPESKSFPPGHIRNPIKPIHTPSLLEMLGINPFKDSCAEWCRYCENAVRDSKAHRLGVKNGAKP